MLGFLCTVHTVSMVASEINLMRLVSSMNQSCLLTTPRRHERLGTRLLDSMRTTDSRKWEHDFNEADFAQKHSFLENFGRYFRFDAP